MSRCRRRPQGRGRGAPAARRRRRWCAAASRGGEREHLAGTDEIRVGRIDERTAVLGDIATRSPPATARPFGSPRRLPRWRTAPFPASAALRGGSSSPTSPIAADIHPPWHSLLLPATKKHEMHQNRVGGRYARVMAADGETTWLGTALAARRMGITTRTLYKFIDAGELP